MEERDCLQLLNGVCNTNITKYLALESCNNVQYKFGNIIDLQLIDKKNDFDSECHIYIYIFLTPFHK